MKQRLKAEMWDKMQYLFRNYYDRMVHCVIYFDSLINVDILKQCLIFINEKNPVLHSSFHYDVVDPYWEVENYVIDDFLVVKDSEDVEADVNEHITQSIPVDNNAQYRIGLYNKDGKTTFAMIINHMCCDGGDLKYFIRHLAECYTKLLNGQKDLNFKGGNRSYNAVYSKMDEKDEKYAKGLYKNISTVEDKNKFPLTPDSKEDKCMICRRKTSEESFKNIYKIGKSMGVTVNDMMLAFYMRALYDISEKNPNETISVPCMVDLRRYIEGGGEKGGLTNHTGFMQCTTKEKGETINDTLVNVLHSIRKNKKDRFMGLYSLPLLKLAYTILPFTVSEFAIKLGYSNPLIGMSNIGLLKEQELMFGEAKPIDAFMTGAIKYKPYMQLALTTFNNRITMTIVIRGNEEDEKIVGKFFDLIEQNMAEFIELNKSRL